MTLLTRTLTLPVHANHVHEAAHADWRRRWRYEADAFTNSLGPRHGVQRLELDRDAGTVTVQYDPEHFSLDQLKALGRDMGLLVGGAVYHTILDLPQCTHRTAMALELQSQLQRLPGVARVALNPTGRTLTIEYIATEAETPSAVTDLFRRLGFQVRDLRLPEGWWERHQLSVYTLICLVLLISGWLAERMGAAPWLALTLFGGAYLAGGGVAALNGLRSLRQGTIDVDFLMVAAAVGAATIGEWVEGGTLLFLFSLSNALQQYALDRTRQAIRALMDLRPATARLQRPAADGAAPQVVEVPVEQLVVGDRIEVRPGERLPADGEVVAGQSAVDQSPITGESIPVPRGPGDPVFAGSINGGGALTVRVTHRAADSTLARIILLVEEAQSERAPTQKRLDAFEQKYAAGVVSMAALTALAPPLFFGWNWPDAFYKAMTLLVVASPCALVISTPASILSAIAAGARQGVLFKGGAHIESLGRVRVVAFDKTGTLTVGRPRVTDVLPHSGPGAQAISADELLALAAAVESRSEHPLARAIVTAAQYQGLAVAAADGLQAVPGKGVTASVNGVCLHIGTLDHLREQGVSLPESEADLVVQLEAQGKTVVFAGSDRLLGAIAVADTVRPEAAQAVAALKSLGIQKVVMLTGDNRRAAQAIGAAAGVDEVRAELLPEEKVAAVKALLAEHGAVAMVGDGVNDAPALATATVGIAMGAGGTDVALETADVVLMASDLAKLPYALGLGRRAMTVVRQNLTFALAVIVTLIASALLNLVSLPLGVIGHEGSTVIVVLNGLRLLGYRHRA
jgi:Cd2+/Zn2+-exporting ATPase